MKTRSKIVLAAAVVAALAGTSGAALAAISGAALAAGTSAAPAAPQAATKVASQVTSQTIGTIYSARLGSSSVREPGSLTVTVAASACVTDVRVWAYSGGAQGIASSPVDTRKGTTFTLHVSFPKGAPTGTWYFTSADATECGTTGDPWNTEWDGYDTFTVLPPKS